ncbi:MAG: class I SAM-dependent methyltransferase [Xanthobacteraceae bacterium]
MGQNIAMPRLLAASTTPDIALIDAALSPRVCRFIQTNLSVVSVPSVPEIRLHKANPKSGLWRLAKRDDDFDTPYWAYLWGGGLALARYVLDHPATVGGCRVLDLGCGSGLVGIAAAKSGAKEVIAADIDRYALAAATLNAELNGVRLRPILGDLTAGSPPAVDVILVGDLFYEQHLARAVATFFDRCFQSNITILIGDPGRAFLPRERLRLLAEYPGCDFADAHRAERTRNAVFSLRARLGAPTAQTIC